MTKSNDKTEPSAKVRNSLLKLWHNPSVRKLAALRAQYHRRRQRSTNCFDVRRRGGRNEYPPNWKNGTIQARIRQWARHRCEHCGMKFWYGTNRAIVARNKNGKPCIGTVHHLNGDKSDVRWENLVYCCQRCHLHIQGVWTPGAVLPVIWKRVPQWITARRLRYQQHIQIRLF